MKDFDKVRPLSESVGDFMNVLRGRVEANVRAIETKYRGYLFRSRLEAKWAAFFDLCGWRWSYEPLDFNGWIPDFAIGERPTLVEIKPFFHLAQWDEELTKIRQSGCKENVVLLGADAAWLCDGDEDLGSPVIGYLLERLCLEGVPEWEVCDLHFGSTAGNEQWGLCPMEGSWRNCVWNVPNDPKIRKPNKWARVFGGRTELPKIWAEACNTSRWIPVAKQ